jgi:hypothetical protein
MEEQYITEIVQLLGSGTEQKFSAKELARKIDRNRYREDANWLRSTLDEMVNRKLIQADESHHYSSVSE